MNLPRIALGRQTIVWILVIAFMAAGIYNYGTISRREDPEIKISVALVITIWPGASAEKVESLITRKIEAEAFELGAIDKVQSTTRDNLSVVFVEAVYDADIDMVWQRLRNKLSELRPELPQSIIGPDVMDDFGDVTAMIWSFSSDSVPPRELADWADLFRAELRKIDSVGKVELIGEREEAIYIEGPLESFTLYSFSPLVAAKLLDAQNVQAPSGYVRSLPRKYRLETTGDFDAAAQIGDAILDVSRKSGAPLKVRDVFDVRRGYREPPTDFMLTDGVPSVGVDVRMKSGNNIVSMGDAVKQAAREFAKRLPPGVKMALVHDQPRHVDEFIDDFMLNLVEGLLIVILVIFFAMGMRSAAIVAVGLPLSIVMTFAVMPMFDVDLEMVSIASFIIALGMLVDNNIIVTDNIYSRLEHGRAPWDAAIEGTERLMLPVITGTLATVFAFLPLLIMQEEIGAYIRALPIVVSASLLASLLLAVTVTPILAARFLRLREGAAPQERSSNIMRRYRALMLAGLRRRWLVLGSAVVALIVAVISLPWVGLSFFPQAYRDQLIVNVWMPEGTALAQTAETVREVFEILEEEGDDVVSHAAYVGKGGPRFHITVKPEFNTTNYAQVMVNTAHPSVTRPLVERLNRIFRERIAAGQVSAENLYMGIPVDAPIAIRVTGPETRVMRQISTQVQEILRTTAGTTMVRDNLGEDVVSLKVHIDRDAAVMAGVTNTEVAITLLMAYEGMPVTHLQEGEDEIAVYLRLAEADRDINTTLANLRVPSQATGEKVPLSVFATVEPQWAPGLIKRYDNRRAVTVLSNVHGRLADEVLRDALPRLEALTLPPGYRLEMAGEKAERDAAFGDLLLVFALIVVLLTLMLVLQFNSFRRALVILFSVPLAFVGAVIGLAVSGNSFSFMAFLGVVSLAGMVIKNAVVWVEFVESSLREGRDLTEAIVEAGHQRLRPILLTAGTTIGGLLPLALFGGDLWEGMAWAMIFGLALATILTLLVIPVAYHTIFRSSASLGAGAGALLFLVVLGVPTAQARAEHPLEKYMTRALQHSISAQKAAIDVEEADIEHGLAGASFAPTPSVELSTTRLDSPQTLAIDSSSIGLPIELPELRLVDQNVYRAAGKLTVPLYAGGSRFAYLSATQHGLAARTRAQSAVDNGLRMGVSAAYVQLLQAQAMVEVGERALQTDERLLNAVEAKADVELATSFDVSLARTRAADSARKLAMAKSEARRLQYAFNDLVGSALGAPIELQPVGFDPEFSPDNAALLADARERPEILARVEALSARQETARATKSELLPTLAVIGEGGYKKGELGYLDGDGYWQLTAAMQWNALLDLSAWYRVRQANVQARRAELEVAETERRLELALAQALQQLRDAEAIFEAASLGVATARRGYSDAKEAYAAGVLPLSDLLDAARARADAEGSYLEAYYFRVLAETNVRYQAGRPVLVAANLNAVWPFEWLDRTKD